MVNRQLLFASLLAALSSAGCNSECEQACEDWADTCSEIWGDHEAACSENCDFAANYGWEQAQTDCYACYARHKGLCTDDGSATRPGGHCFDTCSFADYGQPKTIPVPADLCQPTCADFGLCHDNGQCICVSEFGQLSYCVLSGTTQTVGSAYCCESWSNAECAAATNYIVAGPYLCQDGTCGDEPYCVSGRWW